MPLRIGFFQAGYPVPDGTTTAVHGLALGLARRGVNVSIYGCGPHDALSSLQPHPNLRVELFPRSRHRGFSVTQALLHKLELNADRIDLLVINTMYNPPNVAVARAARRGRIPYVVSPHDPYHPELVRKNRLRKSIYAALFERALLKNAAAVQVLATSHAQWLYPLGVRTVLIVPNGYEAAIPKNVSEQAPDGARQLRGNPRLLCLGRLDLHHKGLDLLIRGFARALRSSSLTAKPELNFVGRGTDDLARLQSIVRDERIADRVHFLGEVSDQARRRILADCDLLLLCSRYDGFGLVVLEAMQAGRPVLVSSEAGVAAWVQLAGAGFITEPAAPSIADTLLESLSRRDEWGAMGRNGRKFVQEHLGWDRIADQAEHCYSQLLRRMHTSRPFGGQLRVIQGERS